MQNDQRLAATLWRGTTGLWIALATLLAVGGCSDHRISLEEFMALQGMREQEAVDEAPPEVDPRTAKLIDYRLGPYQVGPSDVLLLTFTGPDPAPPLPPMSVRVDRDGNVNLPIVGKVLITDLEIEDVEKRIQEALVPEVLRDAVVHVQLEATDLTEVLVVGAVSNPGLVSLERTRRDMLHAIVAAGGVSELASGTANLRRLREPGEDETLDLNDPEGIRKALALDPLQDGDIIEVRAATPNTVFVGGLVNAPRPQMYPPGVEMSVLQALAASGGLRTDVTPREATLIRRVQDGRDIHVKLNLDRISTGEDPNIMLAAGDVLWVPDTLETRVQDFINRNFFIRAGVAANLSYNVSGVEYINRRGQQSGSFGGSGLEQTFDPFGFLQRNQALQNLTPLVAP